MNTHDMAIIFEDAKENLDIFIDKLVYPFFFEFELDHDRIEQGVIMNGNCPLDHQYMTIFHIFKDPYVDLIQS